MKEHDEAYKELSEIIHKNFYRHNSKFKEELLAALKQKTGNENVGILCSYIIDNAIITKSHKI